MAFAQIVAGRTFGAGRYQLADAPMLGKGAGGCVYQAAHLESGETVATKWIDRVDFVRLSAPTR